MPQLDFHLVFSTFFFLVAFFIFFYFFFLFSFLKRLFSYFLLKFFFKEALEQFEIFFTKLKKYTTLRLIFRIRYICFLLRKF